MSCRDARGEGVSLEYIARQEARERYASGDIITGVRIEGRRKQPQKNLVSWKMLLRPR